MMWIRIAIAASCSSVISASAAAQTEHLVHNKSFYISTGVSSDSITSESTSRAAPSGFEMFGVTPSAVYSGEIQVAGKKCKLKGSGEENCVQIYGPASISEVRLKILLFMFNNGKLFNVAGTAASSNFSRVSEAFEAKYGKPYKTEGSIWRNRAGASFDNVIKTWIFSDGILKLEALGDKLDEMRFVFVSLENAPERDAPKVNF
jgi:hypothetical protein